MSYCGVPSLEDIKAAHTLMEIEEANEAFSRAVDELLADMPAGPPPEAPAHHVDSEACGYGWAAGDPPHWLACDCEDPARPWPPRAATDGPRDCTCALCSGKPRADRGRAPCEYADHHCDACHAHAPRICTAEGCRS